MEIHKTTVYDNFKTIISNREIDRAHVKKLARSIQRRNLLYIRPVIVNEHMQVIDGQHRVEACRLINVPVYYIIAGHLTKEDIAILNTAQKNWSRMDFINFYAIEGRLEYKTLSKLINKYPEIAVSNIIAMVCTRESKIREGVINLTKVDRANQIFEWLMDLYKEGYDFVLYREFIPAFDAVVKTEDDFAHLLTRGTDSTLYQCGTTDEYKNLLAAIVFEV